MRHKIFLACAVLMTAGLLGCAEFDKKFDQVLFGSEENIQAAHADIAENRKKDEVRRREKLEKELYHLICNERKKRGLPCDSRDWNVQERARAEAALLTEHCAVLSPSYKDTVPMTELGFIPQDGQGGRALFACRANAPQSVLKTWAADKYARAILWDPAIRSFGVAVHRRDTGGAYSWVLLVNK